MFCLCWPKDPSQCLEVPWVVVMLRLGRHCVIFSRIIVVWAAEVLDMVWTMNGRGLKSPNGDNQPDKGRKSRKGKLVLIPLLESCITTRDG